MLKICDPGESCQFWYTKFDGRNCCFNTRI